LKDGRIAEMGPYEKLMQDKKVTLKSLHEKYGYMGLKFMAL
jgi:hypothetical protein